MSARLICCTALILLYVVIGANSWTIDTTKFPTPPTRDLSWNYKDDFKQCKFSFGINYQTEPLQAMVRDGIPEFNYSTFPFDYVTVRLGDIEPLWAEYWEGIVLELAVQQDRSFVAVADVIAKYLYKKYGIVDCNVNETSNLCTDGANYIRSDWDVIIAQYDLYAQTLSEASLTKSTIWMIEPNFEQYRAKPDSVQIDGGIPADELGGKYFVEIVSTIKKHLPNARICVDISPWLKVAPVNEFALWMNNYPEELIDCFYGGQAASGAKFKDADYNDVLWTDVAALYGGNTRPIFSDCGYGVDGVEVDNCSPWMVGENLTNRLEDNAMAISMSTDTYQSIVDAVLAVAPYNAQEIQCPGDYLITQYLELICRTLSGFSSQSFSLVPIPSQQHPSETLHPPLTSLSPPGLISLKSNTLVFSIDTRLTISPFDSFTISIYYFSSINSAPLLLQTTPEQVPLNSQTTQINLPQAFSPTFPLFTTITYTRRSPDGQTVLEVGHTTSNLFTVESACGVCQNSGICGYNNQCLCRNGYSGSHCETAPCSQCKNDATCKVLEVFNNHPDAIIGGECVCASPWSGSVCEVPVQCETASKTQCKNDGLLTELLPNLTCDLSQSCQCVGNWSGKTCATCPALECKNGGRSSAKTCSCLCATGYVGSRCECQGADISVVINAYNKMLTDYHNAIVNKTPISNELVEGNQLVMGSVFGVIVELLAIDPDSIVNFAMVPNGVVTGDDYSTVSTKINWRVYYGCSENNPLVTKSLLTSQFQNTLITKFPQHETVQTLFTFPNSDDPIDGTTTITDTPSTLGPDEEQEGNSSHTPHLALLLTVITIAVFFFEFRTQL